MSEPLRTNFAEQRRRIAEQSKTVDAKVIHFEKHRENRATLSRQSAEQTARFQEAYELLLAKTNAVCHDILMTRSCDEWSLAFSYLTSTLLAQLAYGQATQDEKLFRAMIHNFERLSEEMAKSFPDRSMIMNGWNRAISGLGEGRVPELSDKVHPQTDSLSRIILTLRDTGPRLNFREFYARSENGLHIVRPA